MCLVSDPDSTPGAAKDALRARIRAARRERTPEERDRAAGAIAQHGGHLLRSLADGPAGDMPLLVAAHLSQPTEPGTDQLIGLAHADHHAMWVPRVEGEDLAWVAYRLGTPLHHGPFGIREPEGPAVRPADLVGMDVMFVPGLAVDEMGRRLGQGGGYFDRMLATFPRHVDGGPLIVVVLFDDEVLSEVPVEDHDCCVDVALTPSGLLDLG
jgi:5-formyltetrahydrofolate cyclo-ligase